MKILLMFFCFLAGFLFAENAGDTISLIPDETDLIGTWHGFLISKNEPVFCSTEIYSFSENKTWSIQEDNQEAIPQGWYKISNGILLLQPKEAMEKRENSAIYASIINSKKIEIPNPFDNDYKLQLIKADSIERIEKQSIIGKWKMFQKNVQTGDIKKAPFLLTFFEENKYVLEQENSEKQKILFSPEWATGIYRIHNNLLILKNAFPGQGLWDRPIFFLLGNKLRYNNAQYCIWCERIAE